MVQIYFNELTYPTLIKPRNQLLLFNKGKPQIPLKKTTLCNDILKYCMRYCNISSIHGVSNITNPKRRYFERVIWLLLIIAGITCCFYIYTELNELYHSQRLVTFVEDSLAPVYSVPFPSVGICPRNRINWAKLLVAHQIFLAPNATSAAITTFRRFFANLGDFRFGKFSHLQPLTATNLTLSLLDDVDIKGVMNHVGFSCDEFFEYPCHWRQRGYNCCDLFNFKRTEIGFCYIFNSLSTENDRERMRNNRFYPYRNAETTEGSGLDVTVKLDESKQPPHLTGSNGIYVMIKQPQLWNDISRFIRSNTYTKIPVAPQSTLTDPKTRSISPVERKCFFEDENWHSLYKKLPGVEYRRSNCYSRCRQEYVFAYCKCNLNLFFPEDPRDRMPACKAKDYKCFYEYRDLFGSEYHNTDNESKYIEFKRSPNESMICNCLSSCIHLIYDTTYISEALKDINHTNVVKHVRLDVHYKSNYIRSYSTRLRYTFVELVANFGGIFGLFLGASLMSVVELVYYFTVGLNTHLHELGYTFKGGFALPKRNLKSGAWKKSNKKQQQKLFLRKSKKNRINNGETI